MPTLSRFQAQRGSAVAPMLEARAILMRFMGSLAGHWPHTLCLQPGGVTKVVSAAERVRLQQWLRTFRRYLEQHTFGLPLEAIAALDTPEALAIPRASPKADFACFLTLPTACNCTRWAAATTALLRRTPMPRRMAAGARPAYGRLAAACRWRWTTSARTTTAAGWLAMARQRPATDTVPLPDKAEGYSWSKAPRIAGAAAETGALARGLLRGEPLLLALVQSMAAMY
jgi:hydrogenase large subunit